MKFFVLPFFDVCISPFPSLYVDYSVLIGRIKIVTGH